MMFKTVLVALAALASVSALPFNDPRSLHTGVRVIGLSLRSVEPQVPEIAVRGEHMIQAEKRADIPAEFPVKSDANREVVPYDSKRSVEERDVEDFEERDLREVDWNIVSYDKKRSVEERDVEERDLGDVDWEVVSYDKKRSVEERDEDELEKRQEIFPEELPTKAENGRITPYKRDEPEVPFHKRVIPAHIAVRTNEHGEIVPY